MAQIGAHGRGQREVLGGRPVVACACEGKAEPELRVVVGGASLDDTAEVRGRCRILAGVELRSRERLQHASGPRLGGGGAFEQLGGGRGAASAKQVETAFVELVRVSAVFWNRIWSIL